MHLTRATTEIEQQLCESREWHHVLYVTAESVLNVEGKIITIFL